MQRFCGKVSLVTGSTTGIGYAIAERFLEEGGKVVVSSRKSENVEKAVSALRKKCESLQNGSDVSGKICHIGNGEERSALVSHTLERFGKIDILVNNAAVAPPFSKVAEDISQNPDITKSIRFMGEDHSVKLFKDTVAYASILDIEKTHIDKVFSTNVTASFLMSKAVAQHMVTHSGGSILFTSSLMAYLPVEGSTSYSASKTALVGLTKTMAAGLARYNIRVNCIAPGIIEDTENAAPVLENEELKNLFLSLTPLQRFGLCKEVAGPAAFLCSDDASYITGETLPIAGGTHLHL